MAFTYGFYNSLNGDRRYRAEQFNDLIGSLLTDGVFENIGSKLFVTAGTGMDINVGTGKAWFDNTWNVNDSVMVLTVPQSDITRPRYDAVVLDVDSDLSARENKIMIVSGDPGTTPVKPTLINTEKHHQHPLAYILVPAAATEITASNIEIVVGQTACPFVTGILQTTDITDLYNQWESDFSTWFTNLQTQLTDNVVTNLQTQIDALRGDVDENYVKKADKATASEVLSGTNNTKYVTPASMASVSDKLKDSDGALLSFRKDFVGLYIENELRTMSGTSWIYNNSYNNNNALNIVKDDTNNNVYVLSSMNTASSGIAINTYLTRASTATSNPSLANVLQIDNQITSSNAYARIRFTEQMIAIDNSLIGLAIASSTRISNAYDVNRGGLIGIDYSNYCQAIGKTESYYFSVLYNSNELSIAYRTHSISGMTYKPMLSSHGDFVILGIYSNTIYFSHKNINNNCQICSYSIGSNALNTNILSMSDGEVTYAARICFTDDTFYAILKKDSNYYTKVLFYNMATNSHNYAAVKISTMGSYQANNINYAMRYLCTSKDNDFILLNYNSAWILFRVNKTTLTFSIQNLVSFVYADSTLFNTCIGTIGHEIKFSVESYPNDIIATSGIILDLSNYTVTCATGVKKNAGSLVQYDASYYQYSHYMNLYMGMLYNTGYCNVISIGKIITRPWCGYVFPNTSTIELIGGNIAYNYMS